MEEASASLQLRHTIFHYCTFAWCLPTSVFLIIRLLQMMSMDPIPIPKVPASSEFFLYSIIFHFCTFAWCLQCICYCTFAPYFCSVCVLTWMHQDISYVIDVDESYTYTKSTSIFLTVFHLVENGKVIFTIKKITSVLRKAHAEINGCQSNLQQHI